MGLHADSVARRDRWAHEMMFMYYLSELEIPEASAMAGFHSTRYELKGDRLAPSLSLQRLVFLMIEDQYAGIDAAGWKSKCDKVMQHLPETATSIIRFTFLQQSTDFGRGKKKVGVVQEGVYSFILQEAACFLSDDAVNRILRNEIFQLLEFVQYKQDLLKAMEVDRESIQSFDGDQSSPVLVVENVRLDNVNRFAALQQQQMTA
ncbi:hypothetical protein BGZ51_002866 [Haplosporangium sp. Z 767]|nr:hypothetical protein BGZ50_008211 [Haplosporangium sp. Z 11]KAF9193578.1 hypothetical protein BGZ51_002866 [Haplosporangium sp. Z 767]